MTTRPTFSIPSDFRVVNWRLIYTAEARQILSSVTACIEQSAWCLDNTCYTWPVPKWSYCTVHSDRYTLSHTTRASIWCSNIPGAVRPLSSDRKTSDSERVGNGISVTSCAMSALSRSSAINTMRLRARCSSVYLHPCVCDITVACCTSSWQLLH